MALPAGTYMFRLPDGNNLQMVQVLSQDGRTVYGMFFTVPEFKAKPVDEPTVIFNESSGKAPREFGPGSTKAAVSAVSSCIRKAIRIDWLESMPTPKIGS